MSCSIPLYCCHSCQVQAGGQLFKNHCTENYVIGSLPVELEEYMKQTTVQDEFHPNTEHIFEHKHECGGVHWPIILPSDIALAGRILAKSIEQTRASAGSNLLETLVSKFPIIYLLRDYHSNVATDALDNLFEFLPHLLAGFLSQLFTSVS